MMRLLASTGARVPSLSRSKRKVAADHFREQIRRSNEFHVAYLLPLFSDLHAEDGYAEAIDFVISDLAGIGISSRDQRIGNSIASLRPGEGKKGAGS